MYNVRKYSDLCAICESIVLIYKKNCPNFRVSMSHRIPATKITVAENPPEKAPPYPGKYSRNHKDGPTMTSYEWLDKCTDRWVQYMKGKPAYTQSYHSVKDLVLHSHLRRIFPNLHSGKKDYVR